ncbi:DUF58 domain-containing protein [Paraliomyxa miuraensis]|uniref:DUF58 domain-containing protein n=1 Tax=Paraliomyxa miuraensis TaxID=376150 RepID=UPI00225A29E1|nr:DUF58 domain-containing protein [Paraliomyxa miuraensis]MCX4243954.1 DUF58 domain-containing protein [Paraliomyxa miuraensis]
MIPSSKLVLLMLGPLGLALLTLLDESLMSAMLLVDAAVAGLAGLDALLCWPRRVQVHREVRSVFSVGRDNPVTLHLRSRARRSLWVDVTDDTFDPTEIDGLPARVQLRAHGTASVRYQLRPLRRGAYRLGAHTVRYDSPLRLWIRQLRLPASDEVHVYPDVQAVRAYELLARQDRASALTRATRRPGGENEFERLREYSRDDEFRAIDWKATARRQKLIARQYQLERNQTIELMLDAGRLMTSESQGLPLFDHALNAALLLAHVATRGGDRVGLLAFSDRIRASLAPTAGRSTTVKLVRATYDLHPELVEPDYDAAFSRLGRDLRQRTLVVVLTRVSDDVSAQALARYTRGLLPRHLPLIILLRDPELESTALVDPRDDEAMLFRRAAAAEILGWHDRLARRLRQLGAHVLDVEPRHLTVDLVNRYLEIKVRHLL